MLLLKKRGSKYLTPDWMTWQDLLEKHNFLFLSHSFSSINILHFTLYLLLHCIWHVQTRSSGSQLDHLQMPPPSPDKSSDDKNRSLLPHFLLFCPRCLSNKDFHTKKLWRLSKALIIIIRVSSLFFVCVWIVNDLFCIIDDGRYKQWIMHQPLSFCV